MKVIFLDVDGVLNSTRHFETLQNLYDNGERQWNGRLLERPLFSYFDPQAVEALNWLVRKSKASLVISSTWRLMGVPRLRAKFKLEGVKAPLVSRTPDSFELAAPGSTKIVSLMRGQQIEAWLHQTSYRVTSFVILDDEDDMDKYLPRLIQTSSDAGLTMAGAQRALAMLSETVSL